ncbi:hypothetical protein ACNFJN_16055 [Xenorhabdus budapestensis]|uniref:hypothetical protein n=1 Tax=Xenorhabdus budapestensis TaxID=290110 RepID=UPI003A883407
MIYGSTQKIRGSYIEDPLNRINRRPGINDENPKEVVILSGIHGDRLGDNWSMGDFGSRARDLIDREFYESDVSRYKNSTATPANLRIVKVINSKGLMVSDYIDYYENPNCHVIGGYCYSINDAALARFLRNL